MESVTSYHNRCRLCIAEARLSLKLFETEAIRLDLVNKIKVYLSISVSLYDGLPQQICYECLSRIELFHSYKQSCLESQHTLQHWNSFYGGGAPPDIFCGRNESPDPLSIGHDPFESSSTLQNSAGAPSKQKSCENSEELKCRGADMSPLRKTASEKNCNVSENTPRLLQRNRDTSLQIKKSNSEENLLELSRLKKNVDVEPTELRRSRTPHPGQQIRLVRESGRGAQGAGRSRSKSPSLPQGRQQLLSLEDIQNSEYLNIPDQKPGRLSRALTRDLKRSGSESPRERSRTRSQSSPREVKYQKESDSELSPKSSSPYRRQDPDVKIAEPESTRSQRGRRAATPGRELKASSLQEISPLRRREAVHSKSPDEGSKTKTEVDSPRKSQKLPKIVEVLSLAPFSSLMQSPEVKRKRGRPPKYLSIQPTTKEFAPTISETVKQRRRSNSGLSYDCVKRRKPRANMLSRTKSLTDLSCLGLVAEEKPWHSEPEDDTESVQNCDTRSVQSMDDGILDVDYETDCKSDYYQSDTEFSESEGSRPPTPGPRNPLRAYVRVEKLSHDEARSSGLSEDELNVERPRKKRRRGQSNQYRMVKIVTDELTGRTRFKCLMCGSLLSQKSYIKEHMKIHTGDKEFVCSVCNKAFRNNYMLKTHMGVHITERAYKCDICNHTFVQYDRLRQHMRIHVNGKFPCTLCDRVCSQKETLKRHMRIHTGVKPYECEVCETRYTDRTTLMNHRRTHTGERPFQCKYCKKRFSLRMALRVHIKQKHLKLGSLLCLLCKRSFLDRENLERHMPVYHGSLYKSVHTYMGELSAAS